MGGRPDTAERTPLKYPEPAATTASLEVNYGVFRNDHDTRGTDCGQQYAHQVTESKRFSEHKRRGWQWQAEGRPRNGSALTY